MKNTNILFEMLFKELIDNNKTCKINLDYKHRLENFDGISIYVMHPKSKELFNVELGVNKDGTIYRNDYNYGCRDEYKEIPIEAGLKILMAYKELINKRDDLERLLVRNRLDKCMVKIKIK